MISIYRTDQGWYSNFEGAITYHQDFREAMDAAYRQATRDGAAKQSHPEQQRRVILQRAAMFLEGAHEVRAGCTNQRAQARRAQANAWKKKVDSSITW